MRLNTDKNTFGVKRLKTPICLLILALISMLISGCAPLPIENWKEEVQLSDSRIIVVERELIFERGGGEWARNPRGIKPAEHRIRFVYPEGSEKIIEWRSLKKFGDTFPEIPLILDFESGHPIVFSAAGLDATSLAYSKYIYKNDLWVEEALPEKFKERTTNLFIDTDVDMPKFVDMEAKRKSASEYHHPSLRQVGPTRKVSNN